MDKNKIHLTAYQVSLIEAALSRGDRIELIPVKEGVRVIRIDRKELKQN